MAKEKAGQDMVYCKSCGKEIAKTAKSCPSCGAENKQPFYKSTIFILLMIFVFLPLCGCGLFSAFTVAMDDATDIASDSQTTEKKDVEDTNIPEETPLKAGDAIEGISPAEIHAKHSEEDAKSSYKAEVYRDSLAGTKVVWVAKISNVRTETFGDEPYLSLDSGKLDVFVHNPDASAVELPKGTLVKVSGTIDEVDSFLGLSADFEGATIEVIEQ